MKFGSSSSHNFKQNILTIKRTVINFKDKKNLSNKEKINYVRESPSFS